MKKSTGGRQRGQMTPTPERITEIQEALSKNGAMSAAPSGKWDDSTADAMRKFQAAHGLNPTGKLDAQTLNHLGLGSSTAGMAPPAPTVRTSSATLPADIQQ
jgi:peptidoglycan hydrolase-like protein with peptidoglycan-binding domain